MVWDAHAPTFVVQTRTEVASLPAWIAEVGSAGQESLHVHYPTADPFGTNEAPDPLPLILLTQDLGGRRWVADGVAPLRRAHVIMDLYVPVERADGTLRTVAQVEALADAIVGQLFEKQPRVLPLGDCDYSKCSVPSPMANSGNEDGTARSLYHIRITLPLGYHV